MECPKCGHQQDEALKCASCGIYFEKFARQQARQASAGRRDPGERGFSWASLAVTAVISAALAVYFLGGRGAVRAPAPAPTAEPAAGTRSAEAGAAVPADAPRELLGLEAQLAKSHPARNAIESARNATVFIRTGWGLGSGFIIDGDCHVITNRHVVETDGARVANAVTATPERRSQMAAAEQQLRASIAQQQQLRRALAGQPGTNLQLLQIEERIQTMRQELADLPARVNHAISEKVQGSGRSGFRVTLVDGTEFDSLHADYADRADLAIFQLPADHCPHLDPGDSLRLAQGERLYTIGNPSGLAYSVTSGSSPAIAVAVRSACCRPTRPSTPATAADR
jgi:serine protease Do